MVLVGSYCDKDDKGIYNIDVGRSGELRLDNSYLSGESPSYLIRYKNELISVNENDSNQNISRFNIDKGFLKRSASYSSGGIGPCHLLIVEENLLLCSNYDSGSLSLLEIGSDSINLCDVVIHKGMGPNRERQKQSHIHSVTYNSKLDILYVVDLGGDEITSYNIFNKKLIKFNSITLRPGDGPRLMTIDEESDIAYVVNELSNTITIFKILSDGELKEAGRFSTLPKSYLDESFASHILISNCKKYLFISNRGHNSIVVYEICDDYLKNPKWYGCGGSWPRFFCYSSDGKYLLVANQESSSINSLRVTGGSLIDSGHLLTIDKPTIILPY